MTCTLHDSDGAVYIVISPNWDLEVLSARPKWDLGSLGQKCFVANINGGDSQELHLCDVEGCDNDSVEFYETNDDEGANVCQDHYDALVAEFEARAAELPTFTPTVKMPLHDWLEMRPYPALFFSEPNTDDCFPH